MITQKTKSWPMALLLIVIVCMPFTAFSMVDPVTPTEAVPANGDSSWTLDFSDEFNGVSLDTTKWGIDVSSSSRASRPERGISDWWWKSQNVYVDGVGNLVLDVTKYDNNTMHCGSVSSDGLYEPQYGYLEARIEIADSTKDTHTAFWLQGHNQGNIDGTGNDGAEVDIFESAWFSDYTKSVVHIDGYGASHQANTDQYNTPGLHSGYHTFGVEWNKHVMNIYYDGQLRTQYEGIWVPQVPEYLWLSDGASFGDIGTFTSEPIGWLTDARFDYVRAWKPSSASTIYLVGGDKMNGNFNADPGGNKQYQATAGWYNAGSGAQSDVATKNDAMYDGSQNAVIACYTGREFGMNTGYEMVEGDAFDVAYVWKDDFNWVDTSDRIRVSLFVTSDDTTTGTRTDLVSDLSDVSSLNGTYESVYHTGIYTATASDAGKVVFVSIDGNDSGSGGFARLDNFELIRHSYVAPNNPPVFTSDPFSTANATENSAYSTTIAGSATDADNDPRTYSAIAGPSWLTVASDGALSGTPSGTDVGANSWTVQVSDGNGGTDMATLNITVDAAGASMIAGYTVGSGLLSPSGENLFVDYAVLGGNDLTDTDGYSDAFTLLIDGAGQWTLGDTVEITGIALPVHGATVNGDMTFTIRQGAGGAGDTGAGGLAVLGTATASYGNSGSSSAMYVNFDTPVSFVVDANSTRIGINISNTGFLRLKHAAAFPVTRYDLSTGNALSAMNVSVAGTVTPSATPTCHVSSIVPSIVAAGGPNRFGVATVTILDANDQPVSGATVSGSFTGSYSESGSAVTDASGSVVIQTTSKTKNPSFTFTVDDVTASGYTYDSVANVETSDSY